MPTDCIWSLSIWVADRKQWFAAPNVAVGAKIAYAPVGTKLIDGHTGETAVLKPAKIRGVASNGMCCSEKELGISENHEGILILRSDTLTGTPLTDCIGDAIFDLEVTPNRPDCLSMIGWRGRLRH